MYDQHIIPHLFRTEYSKIVAVLCKSLGLDQLETAEDIASDTFVAALHTWPYKGVPVNPVGWLYTVAKNKTYNYITRANLFNTKIAGEWTYQMAGINDPDIDLSDSNIKDSQLKMLFTVCHPQIPVETQAALALRILCGFGIHEIATAFVTNHEVVSKRLYRAREKIRTEKILLEFPPADRLSSRLPGVLTTLYLLFSEGYYSETEEEVIREELCAEAMRMTYMLTHDDRCNTPEVNALLALMCFQCSRFPARKDQSGNIVLYHEQDLALWNQELVNKGVEYLRISSAGNGLSKYHLEAAIAYWYTVPEAGHDKWHQILELYNHLLVIEYSPVAALNRTYALSMVKGKKAAIEDAEKLDLHGNPYYHALLGWLYSGVNNDYALNHYKIAHQQAKTNSDKQLMLRKMKEMG